MIDSESPIIDTHFHIWDAEIFKLPTLDVYPTQLKRKYTLDDYQKAIQGTNITKSIYTEVDTIKEQHQQETDMIIDICHDGSNAVIGATIAGDLSSKDFPTYIQQYAKKNVVKSVRHNLFLADPSVTTSPIFLENTRLLGKLGLMCDLVMPSAKIMQGVDLVKACPDTQFVIDHCGVCPILSDRDTREHWKLGIIEYAQCPNTICKVSECGFTSPDYAWKVPDVVEIIHHCITSFGEDRIVYGTNWPVCEITGNIQRWFEALEVTLGEFPARYSKKLFSQNAMRFYKVV